MDYEPILYACLSCLGEVLVPHSDSPVAFSEEPGCLVLKYKGSARELEIVTQASVPKHEMEYVVFFRQHPGHKACRFIHVQLLRAMFGALKWPVSLGALLEEVMMELSSRRFFEGKIYAIPPVTPFSRSFSTQVIRVAGELPLMEEGKPPRARFTIVRTPRGASVIDIYSIAGS